MNTEIQKDIARTNMRIMWTAQDIDYVMSFIQSPLGTKHALDLLKVMKERLVCSIIK